MEWKNYACTLRITLASEQQQLVGECTAACAVCCGDTGSMDIGECHPLANADVSAMGVSSSHSSQLACDESTDLGLADGWSVVNNHLLHFTIDVLIDTTSMILAGVQSFAQKGSTLPLTD
jgi:hypothetical protein